MQKEYESFRQRASQSYFDVRELSIQLSEQIAVLRVFFGEDVSLALMAVRDKGNSVINAPMPSADIRTRVHALLMDGKSPDLTLKMISAECDLAQETHYPKAELLTFFEKITKHFEEPRAGA